MEFNETIVISFLVVVIIILIFSKISVGSDSDESEYINDQFNKLQAKLMPTKAPNEFKNDDDYSFSDNDSKFKDDEELLTEEFKKQLKEMENRFYYDNCRYNKN